jgi:hypothetical protein
MRCVKVSALQAGSGAYIGNLHVTRNNFLVRWWHLALQGSIEGRNFSVELGIWHILPMDYKSARFSWVTTKPVRLGFENRSVLKKTDQVLAGFENRPVPSFVICDPALILGPLCG